jgi:hypothetical protein
MLKFLTFMAIWISGCAFVDFVVPDIANAWKMAIGFAVGSIGLTISGYIGA